MSDVIERLNAALERRYRIERELGEGGMATVFLADDLRHDRKVALKVLKPELAAVVGAERFLAEIKTTANLQHPHILPLFDSGEADGFLFYVMPYVEGESLREKLDREKQLSVDEAVELTEKIASALQYAHEQDVVHRDIKPANILLSRGEPLVADFGIALALSEAGGGRITETGLSLGTPHYMSPEQASGDQSLDKRSDVYALGCILYELLTGEPPYGGPTAQSVLAKILTGDARRITALRRTVPPHVDAAVAKALEKLPADRFSSAEAFARALDDPAFRHTTIGGASSDRVAATRRPTRRGAVLAGLIGAALVGAVVGYALRKPPPERVFRTAIDFPEGQALFDVPFAQALALTPDGSSLIYAGPSEGRRWQFWLRRADALDATPIQGTAEGVSPVVSPSGDALAFLELSSGDLYVADLRGGTTERLTTNAWLVADWTESGHIYYLGGNTRDWYRIADTGGDPEPLPGPSTPVEWAMSGLPAWGWADILPGERKGVFTRVAANGSAVEYSLVVMDLETGEFETLTAGSNPRYLPSGTLTWATAEGALRAAPFDPGPGRFTGPAVTLAQDIRVLNAAADAAISLHGDLVYLAGGAEGGSMQVVSADPTGAAAPVDPDWYLVPAGGGNWSGLALSPDGTRLVVTDGTESGAQLWVKSLVEDAPPNRITFEGDFHVRPRWNPAGDSVVFITGLGGATEPTQVWITAANGSGSPRQLVAADVEIEEALISPDGEWIVYRQGGTTVNRDIYAMRRDVDSAGRPLIATDGDEKSPQLSPDGRWIAYVSDLTGSAEVFVQPFPDVSGGRWQISVEGGVSPSWAPDGAALYYVDAGGTLTRARLRTTGAVVSVTAREPLFPMAQDYVDLNYPALEVTPDGERFLYFSFETRQEGRVVWARNGLSEQLAGLGGR